jgi:hypothetical protein
MTELAIACWLALAQFPDGIDRYPCGWKRIRNEKGKCV